MSKQSLVRVGAKGIFGLCVIAAISACSKIATPTENETKALTPYIHLHSDDSNIPVLDNSGHKTGTADISSRSSYLAVTNKDGKIEAMTGIPHSVEKIIPGENEIVVDCLKAEITYDGKTRTVIVEICAQRPDESSPNGYASAPDAKP